jgi:exodeoxyribonuclease V alpha subunit
MVEKGVPLRGVHVRKFGKDGFRAIDAVRLDTGMMVKLTGEFDEVDPLSPFVADILQSRLLEGTPPTEIEYRVGPNKTGPETVLSAVDRKRAEGGDPHAEIPAEFRIGYTVTETHCVSSDKSGGPYRIFEAEVGSTRRLAKIVTRVPDPGRVRPVRMALKPSKDRNGRPQREGIYLGEVDTDPVRAFAPELLAPPKRGPSPAPPAMPERSADGPDPEPTRVDGFRRVRPYEEVTRQPNEDGTVFLILKARDLENEEALRVYLDLTPEIADQVAVGRDLLFRETSRKRKRVLELRGEIRIPDPEAVVTPAPAEGDSPADRAEPTAPKKGAKAGRAQAGPVSLKRIGYDPALNTSSKGYSYREVFPRRDGSTQYFYIFVARDLETRKAYKVKLYLPDDDFKRDRTFHLEAFRDGDWTCLRQSSDHPPTDIGAEHFGTGPWERIRVTGMKAITPEINGELEESYQIFDARIEGTDHILKIMGMVPGGDVRRKMTVFVRPKNWRYGEIQYEAGLIEPDPNVTPEVMEGMVARLKAPGLGRTLIDRVVSRFGNESIHVIRYEPERLLEIDGIGPGTVDQIRKANHLDLSASIISAMSENGVHMRHFNGILKTFGKDAVEVITKLPYRLTEVSTISFKYADKIAIEKQGRSRHAPERIEAVLGTAVSQLISSGKSGEWYERVKTKVKTLTDPMGRGDASDFYQLLWFRVMTESDLEDGLVRIIPGQKSDVMIRFQEVVKAEERIAADLHERVRTGPEWAPFDPSTFLQEAEEETEFKLGAEQVEAVRMVCETGTSVMTGGPGVGKTTTLKKTVQALEAAGVDVLLMAPTGIAAKRMRESTGRPASTVHSAIGRLASRDEEGDEEPLIRSGVPTCVVIDESSMVNVFTLEKLLAALPMRVSILFSGDVDQLPSIGPGQILRDLIESRMTRVTRLDTVYRQGPDSEIINAARAINAGEMPQVGEDFRVIPAGSAEEIRGEVIRQVQRISLTRGFDLMRDLMVLSPVKKGEAGVVALNTEIQALLNPPHPSKAELTVPRPPENEDETDLTEDLISENERGERAKKEKVHHEILRVGDRVIHTRNNYDNGLVNGDVGIITSVNPQYREVCVEFNDEPFIMERDGLSDPSNNCHLAETPH